MATENARAAAQALLDKYRFEDNGVELFPRAARDLTAAQLAHVLTLGEKVRRLDAAKATERRLRELKTTLSTIH